MVGVKIEIDGVEHELVGQKLTVGVCTTCSLFDKCDRDREGLPSIICEAADHRYEDHYVFKEIN